MFAGAHTSEMPAKVRGDVRVGKWLLNYDKFTDAYNAGVLSQRHVELLRRAEGPVTFVALGRDQAMLVEFAESLSFDDFGRALQYWVNAVDPDGRIPDSQVAKADFRVNRHRDGSVTVKGRLDPLVGTAIWNAFQAEQQKLLNSDKETGTDRSAAQRRVAAVANLVDRGAQRADGTVSAPLINIVMSQTVAEVLLAQTDDPTVEIPINIDSEDGRCEFIDGTPIHPKLALATLGVATLRRIVLGAKSRPLDVSHNSARFPVWMKQAMLIATRGRCREPGCDAPVHWIHADHIHPRSRGGPTRLNNLDPLCGPANRAKSNRLPTT